VTVSPERTTATAERQSLRPFLARLTASDELLRITGTVDPVYELAAYLAELRSGPAVLFESVRGHDLPVVGNVLNGVARIAAGLGLTSGELHTALAAAPGSPIEPVLVDEGPCQEVVVDDPDLASLPIPTFFEHESGPYVTAGAIVARDRTTGRRNWSIARLKPLGGNEAFVGIAPNHHLAVLARAAQARGETLEIAVTIGNHPALLVAACYYRGLGDDELGIAGALLGEPVALVRCGTVDLEVPLGCEIVLEGTLDPGRTVVEGRVSEFHGLYEDYGSGQVVTFHRLTRRSDAVYQAILPGYHPEHVHLGAVAIAAGLAHELRRAVPGVREVAITEGGCGRLHAVVALGEHRPGDPRKAMFAAWAAVNLVKTVTVVDDDVDVNDPVHVEWALATRMRADRDLVVVPAVRTDRAEPLEQGGVVPKLGIDATRTEGDRADFIVAMPPADVVERVRAALRR
jgi:4-hydroxy-3-polyprenylbenzoate decarboxylase